MLNLTKLLAVPLLAFSLSGCMDDAAVASRNVTKAADNFEVNRRIVFYNGITDTYILTVEGYCSMDLNHDRTAFNVICKVGPSQFRRHSLVLSDNVSAFAEQIEDSKVSSHHYRVTFKPSTIIPDVDIR